MARAASPSARRRRGPSRGRGNPRARRAPLPPDQKPLYAGSDHGRGVRLHPANFAPPQRDAGWGPFAETFLRMNERALSALDVTPEISADAQGVSLRLRPGGAAGAIPLRSAQTGHVKGGFIVRPRFGWSGVGSVLSETGWHAGPQFLEFPLVPGSGREIPPWVLAGPVLARLSDLLRRLRRGFRQTEEVLQRPRGRILWNRYRNESLARGKWHHLPCRFADLSDDDRLRSIVRWTLERVRRDLVLAGGTDPMALSLVALASQLVDAVADVAPSAPSRRELDRIAGPDRLVSEAVQKGLEAVGWIYDERGLGGGREQDGLSWQLPLDWLWENYVEAVIRREVAKTGGKVSVARRGETVFPLHWTDPIHRSLGHLAPDMVVRRSDSVWIVDAKYKAHLAELDEHGWHRFAEDKREAHRADLHQVLAYAALYDAPEVVATLVYPLRQGTYAALRERGRDVAKAELMHGGRRVVVELRGVGFGSPPLPASL